ncbi:heterokaryon incompatibility protein-domain-containing protein [Xylariaceae sp. FL0255]|nr:heterokaryon incompatibility protein-domain-containing protein [Xylariaceae sp. FL0255]
MSRCCHCKELSISRLVDLAKEEFISGRVPEKGFYQHHASIDDLEQSAVAGCDLCAFIFDSFRWTPKHPLGTTNNREWPVQCVTDGDLRVEDSMLSETKSLEATDVRIYLDSDYLWPGEGLEEDHAFDVLRVQIGPARRRSGDEGLWDWEPLTFVMSTPPTAPCAVDGFRVGRLQNSEPDVAPDVNFDNARQWLMACQSEHHGKCWEGFSSELPTRVIDVGSKSSPNSLKLVITDDMTGVYPYVALSHCWGGKVSPLLLSTYLDTFKISMVFQDLPANFQDAITITRELGIRYLWIDSLCIIQDSKRDWEQESKKMGAYYGNSTLTIYALSAEGSTSGILPKVTTSPGPKPVYINVFPDKGAKTDQQVRLGKLTHEDKSLAHSYVESPLSSRGWTLQESLLAPRHLYFSKHHVYWKCLRGFKFSDGLPPARRTPFTTFPSLRQILSRGDSTDVDISRAEILEDYYSLVETYSARHLTYDTDKLPAFAGLAQRIHQSVSGDYLAGIWSADFHRGVSWYRANKTCRHVSSASRYRAPSWSWAVTDEPIVFDLSQELVPNDFFEFDVIDYRMDLADPTNPYGQLNNDCCVHVRGHVMTLLRSTQSISPLQKKKKKKLELGCSGIAYFDDYFAGGEGNEDYQDKEEKENTSSSSTCLFRTTLWGKDCLVSVIEAEVEEVSECDQDFEIDIDTRALVPRTYTVLLIGTVDLPNRPRLGLILQGPQAQRPLGRDEKFERVGFLELSFGADFDWLGEWTERSLTII